MSSSVSDAPYEVANLCSNCQNVQFWDDRPQLYQSGQRLELDREQLPTRKRGSPTGGFLDTDFALTDSYPELPELRKSSQDGCDFCGFLYEIIVSFVSQDLDINKMSGCIMSIRVSYSWAMLYDDGGTYEPENHREVYLKKPNGLDAMLITADFASDEIGGNIITMEMICHVESASDSDAASRWLHLRNRSNQDYCDADSIQWMKETLQTCMEGHGHDLFDPGYIPERLIDVRPEIPRLILRQDHIQSHCAFGLNYTALSYCWGSGESQTKTDVATLSKRQAGITETELPSAIRDAILVTRALDIPFLWVDALCILQDDPSDWERQCTEMHNIYGSAQVTLCAANSRSCDEGFLRQTGRIIRIPFQSRRTPDTKGSFLIQYKGLIVDSSGGLAKSFIYYDTRSLASRWASRGWVYQEKILSTRRLMFGARDLHFLCSESRQRRGQDAPAGPYDGHIGKFEINGDIRDLHRTWNSILSNYSSYKTDSFTNAIDTLPALSGLARLLYYRLKDEYYAGHWRRHLYRSLLWCEAYHKHSDSFWTPSLSGPTSEAFRVPSWSNLNKGLTFFVSKELYADEDGWHDCRSEINLLDANVLLTGANPFGALTGCSLRIRGYTLDLSHKEVDFSEDPFIEGASTETHSLMVHGRHFGSLCFDCKSKLHDQGGKCVAEGDFGQFKLLLLMRCDYAITEATTYSSSEADSNSEAGSSGEVISYQQEKGRGRSSSREDRSEQVSGKKVSAASDDGSDNIQSQQSIMQESPGRTYLKRGDIVRKGFGLILCPTGNDGEFYRVGMFSPVRALLPWMAEVRRTADDLGGDIRELQGLAQVETVQLV